MTLLRRIEHYRAVTGTSETRFGRRAVNDPRLIHDMRHGRRPGPAMIARVEAFMAEHLA